jgi:hypothetical protein
MQKLSDVTIKQHIPRKFEENTQIGDTKTYLYKICILLYNI